MVHLQFGNQSRSKGSIQLSHHRRFRRVLVRGLRALDPWRPCHFDHTTIHGMGTWIYSPLCSMERRSQDGCRLRLGQSFRARPSCWWGSARRLWDLERVFCRRQDALVTKQSAWQHLRWHQELFERLLARLPITDKRKIGNRRPRGLPDRLYWQVTSNSWVFSSACQAQSHLDLFGVHRRVTSR